MKLPSLEPTPAEIDAAERFLRREGLPRALDPNVPDLVRRGGRVAHAALTVFFGNHGRAIARAAQGAKGARRVGRGDVQQLGAEEAMKALRVWRSGERPPLHHVIAHITSMRGNIHTAARAERRSTRTVEALAREASPPARRHFTRAEIKDAMLRVAQRLPKGLARWVAELGAEATERREAWDNGLRALRFEHGPYALNAARAYVGAEVERELAG